MSKNTDLYFQCDLSKGNMRQRAYVEERAAIVGAEIEVGPGTKDFWTVDSVGYPGLAKARLKDIQDDYHKGFESLKGH